ncbi:MAG: hypothetical protein ABEJ03_03030 [Candidatus Nanohaloarchaea archaeon]
MKFELEPEFDSEELEDRIGSLTVEKVEVNYEEEAAPPPGSDSSLDMGLELSGQNDPLNDQEIEVEGVNVVYSIDDYVQLEAEAGHRVVSSESSGAGELAEHLGSTLEEMITRHCGDPTSQEISDKEREPHHRVRMDLDCDSLGEASRCLEEKDLEYFVDRSAGRPGIEKVEGEDPESGAFGFNDVRVEEQEGSLAVYISSGKIFADYRKPSEVETRAARVVRHAAEDWQERNDVEIEY